MSDEKPTKEVVKWSDHPTLKQTRLNELLRDLKEMTAQAADLQTRIEAIRSLIFPLIQGVEHTVEVEDRHLHFYPATASPGAVSETQLIAKLGLTKADLDRCREKPKEKKAYFKVTTISERPADS